MTSDSYSDLLRQPPAKVFHLHSDHNASLRNHLV